MKVRYTVHQCSNDRPVAEVYACNATEALDRMVMEFGLAVSTHYVQCHREV
jgi:hypothetical protein